MQIVIDIDEDLYDTIKNLEVFITTQRSGKRIINGSINAIKNGIRLPKGHGRLVDADAMAKILRESEYYQEKRGDFYGAEVTSRVKNFIEDTDTVIEADKEVDL